MNREPGKREWASPELRLLVAALLDETISKPQWERLEKILLDDEAARRYYVSEVDLAASIEFALRMKKATQRELIATQSTTPGAFPDVLPTGRRDDSLAAPAQFP
jgi:hypothetical protein